MFSYIYHSDFFPKVRKDTLFCREIISEAGKLNAGKGEIRDKRGMDQKREKADLFLFRHGITREKIEQNLVAEGRKEQSGVKANSLLRFK